MNNNEFIQAIGIENINNLPLNYYLIEQPPIADKKTQERLMQKTIISEYHQTKSLFAIGFYKPISKLITEIETGNE